ncbi:MAG: alpha/beta fold hydrolase [Planctomycetota bacterium]
MSSTSHPSLDTTIMDWPHCLALPPFRPHRLWRGGHLQTLVGVGAKDATHSLAQTCRHHVTVSEGDRLVLHEDCPPNWDAAHGSVLLLHGLCGCHAANYMLRFAVRLFEQGVRVFRLDMRGCGASESTCQTITHAGRSEDVVAAIEHIAAKIVVEPSPIGIVGVSLGGNQILRAAGRIGAGFQMSSQGWSRVDRIVAFAPPIDLQSCSDAMERWSCRIYSHYFIRNLLRRARPELLNQIGMNPRLRRSIKTLRLLDRHVTAPLAGYRDERAYYADASAVGTLEHIAVPTLIVAAQNDPLVPVKMFQQAEPSTCVRIHLMKEGGHHGFVQAGGHAWTDDVVAAAFAR